MTIQIHDIPKVGSKWRHKRGAVYRITHILNLHTEDYVKFPVTIAYRDDGGRHWCRPASQWFGSFTEIKA